MNEVIIPAAAKKSIKSKISKLLLIVSLTMAFIVVIISIMMFSINSQYSNALLCANTAAEFNVNFKNTIDLEMYNHVIKPRTPDSINDLPLAELDTAQEVLERLAEATSLPDNKWRVQGMLDMCKNLRKYIFDIAHTDSYDQRMVLLEKNIRGETGLTLLIEQYMHNYIDDEVRELAKLSSVINSQTTLLITIILIVFALLGIFVVVYAVRTTRNITVPIVDLTKKARNFGDNNLTISPISTDIIELQTLDISFDKMADRINMLMEKQIEDQRSLHQAELELLQAQINPHFLYNTLDSIAILAESEREDDVVNMVTSLSTFFRNSLNSGQDIISLKAEISQAKSYLEIQQIRYSDILMYSMDITEDIQDIMVPKLILQPLIENALYHGVKNKRGRGKITITGKKEDNRIILSVSDNGAGMEAEQLEALQSGAYQEHHRGLGLKNVDQRIRLYCGEGFGLSFESILGEGTTVTITLPEQGISENQGENR